MSPGPAKLKICQPWLIALCVASFAVCLITIGLIRLKSSFRLQITLAYQYA